MTALILLALALAVAYTIGRAERLSNTEAIVFALAAVGVTVLILASLRAIDIIIGVLL